MLEAVKQNWQALRSASAELQGDREVVLEAVKQSGDALISVADELRADGEFVLEAVKQNEKRASMLPRRSGQTASLCSRP